MDKLYGNAIVGQSGGPTAAINATLSGVIRGVLDASCNGGVIDKLYGMRNGIEGLLAEELICLNDIFADEANSVMLEHTPSSALGSCRKKLPKLEEGRETYQRILDIFKKYNIRYFFYIGGNDSMDTVDKLSAFMKDNSYGMRIVGVPKTIDNDLVLTDHTPGFGSAAKFIATTIQEIIRDCAVYKIPAVTIVEVMGRDAGWLAASADVGKYAGAYSPDMVYLPEKVFDMDNFFEDVEAALKKHPNVVVCISEGIKLSDGSYVGEAPQSRAVDMFGHVSLSGAGRVLEMAVKEKFGCKVRSIELSLTQRCASHIASECDISESVKVGMAAVRFAVHEGVSGEMIAFERGLSGEEYVCNCTHLPVSLIANKVKRVPDEYINSRANGITAECADYILPLINGEAYPEYENGLPKFFVFD
jgi:6-phosphofructokinase 1